MHHFLRQCAVVGVALSCTAPMVYADPLNYGLVSLSEAASQTITRDEMVLTLSIQEQGSSREKIATIVTNRLNTVLQAAKHHSDFNTTLQSRSASRSYYEITDVNGKRQNVLGWKDIALVQIKSKNLATLNQFAASVQKQAAINDVQYMVSRNVLDIGQKRLTSQAIERFKQRATQITRDLGGLSYKIVQLNIGDGSTNDTHHGVTLYGTIRAGYVNSEAAPVQDSAPGETQLNLSISGQIQVQGL